LDALADGFTLVHLSNAVQLYGCIRKHSVQRTAASAEGDDKVFDFNVLDLNGKTEAFERQLTSLLPKYREGNAQSLQELADSQKFLQAVLDKFISSYKSVPDATPSPPTEATETAEALPAWPSR